MGWGEIRVLHGVELGWSWVGGGGVQVCGGGVWVV